MVRWANSNLVDWLNRSNSAGTRRVIHIIDLAQQAYQIASEAGPVVSDEQYFSCKSRAGMVLSSLNAALFHYNCKAEIRFYGASLHRHYIPAAKSSDRSEIVAVAFLLEYMPVIHRVRRCVECRKWFFGATEHQKYCGSNCRKKHDAQGEEFLERRRAYMREWRKGQKNLDLRARELARKEARNGTRKAR